MDHRTLTVALPGLPPEWEGKRVALLGDFQIGMWLDNEGMVEEAIEEAIEVEASLVLITGDFVYTPDRSGTDPKSVERVVALVRPLVAAGLPVVAVLGNHDYSLMKQESNERPRIAETLALALQAIGATVLENDAIAVPAPGGGGSLYIAGIGSVWADNSRPQVALAAVPTEAPRLVLMHNPESYLQIPAGEAPLALAGHTHGGQIRLPGLRRWSWLDIVREGEVVADGWAEASFGAVGNRLYVNRGIGFSTLPVRINCRPELTTITLRRAAGASSRLF
ncbi:MAG TPA: metallophosphoesterase [Thermoanaerobaculia bacterium]|nr:metallophosphoesterase [Thermoanaerobaculia bacterium]